MQKVGINLQEHYSYWYITGSTTKEIDQQKSVVEVPKHGHVPKQGNNVTMW